MTQYFDMDMEGQTSLLSLNIRSKTFLSVKLRPENKLQKHCKRSDLSIRSLLFSFHTCVICHFKCINQCFHRLMQHGMKASVLSVNRTNNLTGLNHNAASNHEIVLFLYVKIKRKD